MSFHSFKQCTHFWNNIIKKQSRSCYSYYFRYNCPIEDVKWYVTASIWHTYHKEWKIISLVIQLVYKHPITNLDIQIQKGSMLSMMFTFQLQITWINLLIGITKFSIECNKRFLALLS